MLEFLKVIFLGIVEGITEWLPISSTGHMILVDEFVKLNVTHDSWVLFWLSSFCIFRNCGRSAPPKTDGSKKIPGFSGSRSS